MAGEFTLAGTKVNQNIINEINRIRMEDTVARDNLPDLIRAASTPEVVEAYLDFLTANAGNIRGWMQFAVSDRQPTGVGDAIAHRQGVNLIVVEGRAGRQRGAVLHRYDHPNHPQNTIYVVQITNAHYVRGNVQP
jgi:hypothetical protein